MTVTYARRPSLLRYASRALLLLLVVLAVWHFWGTHDATEHDKKGKNDKPVSVALASAHYGDIEVFETGLGTVTPRNNVVVHSRIDGQLMRLYFTEGQMVQEGALLADLDDRTYKAQLTQAEGQARRDKALLAEARVNLRRYQTLFKEDSIARQQLDAQISLVRQYEGAVQNDAGLIESAHVQIVYTHITAPIKGRVGLRQVDPGNIVHASDQNGVAVITQLQPITALFTVPEDKIGALSQAMRQTPALEAQAWDRDNKTRLATGTLIAVDNQVDTTTGTVKLRSQFENAKNELFPNQFVNIRLRLATLRHQLLVPVAAVQHGAQGNFVYRLTPDHTVKMASVTTGESQGEFVIIAKGLRENDQVVMDGTDNLRDGAKIMLRSDAVKQGPQSADDAKPAQKHGRHAASDAN